MNKYTNRFIVSVTPVGTLDNVLVYEWKVTYAPGTGFGTKRTAAGTAETRQKAIAAAIEEAGRLAKVPQEGRAA